MKLSNPIAQTPKKFQMTNRGTTILKISIGGFFGIWALWRL
jgi:hypothetical protein